MYKIIFTNLKKMITITAAGYLRQIIKQDKQSSTFITFIFSYIYFDWLSSLSSSLIFHHRDIGTNQVPNQILFSRRVSTPQQHAASRSTFVRLIAAKCAYICPSLHL